MQLTDWCAAWAENNASQNRKKMLEDAAKEKLAWAAQAKELWTIRFGTKETTAKDGYFAWWMQAQCTVNNASGFFGKRQLQKVYTEGLEQMGLSWAQQNGTAGQALLEADLTQMLRQYVTMSVSDSNYGSIAFGLMPLKEDALTRKLLKEMQDVCAVLPQKAGLYAEYEPLRKAAKKVLGESVTDCAAWQEDCDE